MYFFKIFEGCTRACNRLGRDDLSKSETEWPRPREVVQRFGGLLNVLNAPVKGRRSFWTHV